MKTYVIGKNDAGRRTDKFIKESAPKLPQSLLYKYIRLKKIKVNGKRCDPGYLLCEGDCVCMYINDEFFVREKEILSELPIDIVYENTDVLAVFKPPGLPVHCTNKKNADTLISRVKYYLRNERFTPALCNRLDVNTSGLVIAAKNSKALREINEQLKLRQAVRKYLCVTVNKPAKDSGTLSAYHKINKDGNVSVSFEPLDGYKEIITVYNVLKTSENGMFAEYLQAGLCLLEAELITGRKHQIRAHLSAEGFPILGDSVYGDIAANEKYGVHRQLLCAYKIELTVGGELLTVSVS
ncbi:MAG: RluA family pseudouridine synthase [Oscillospiraceae bacterium]|jgi:23S rRNA pseudouridine955/2504/2580 synthase|nr:RluA family pseudouridine synthase [Oscillospiraceae bacterium]